MRGGTGYAMMLFLNPFIILMYQNFAVIPEPVRAAPPSRAPASAHAAHWMPAATEEPTRTPAHQSVWCKSASFHSCLKSGLE